MEKCVEYSPAFIESKWHIIRASVVSFNLAEIGRKTGYNGPSVLPYPRSLKGPNVYPSCLRPFQGALAPFVLLIHRVVRCGAWNVICPGIYARRTLSQVKVHRGKILEARVVSGLVSA